MSWAIWITGLPGSGKSVIARKAAAALTAMGQPVTVLEMDEVRGVLTPAPTYRPEERDVVYRALAEMAVALTWAGVAVIVDATAHRRAWRDAARARIPHFGEVQLVCPVDVCRTREAERVAGHAPRGIYARAGRPGAQVPGVDVAYEMAVAPELALDTAALSIGEAAAEVVALARRLAAAAPVRPPRPGPGWVLWITGRPGSGKTTIARGVAVGLSEAGVDAALLELPAFRARLLPAGVASAWAEETVHRALAMTAALLAGAGLAVIVDATTPRRAWRAVARALAPRFAEVQLVCPPEVCLERERAARWRLGQHAGLAAAPAAPTARPDLCIEYEESPSAELRIDTHVLAQQSVVAEVLRLARRLGHPVATTPSDSGRRATCECEN